MGYIRRKMEMSRAYPSESRLFANEIIQGAPRMRPHLESDLKPLFDEKCALIAEWMAEGRLAKSDPAQLILSIWAITQHYADFASQICRVKQCSRLTKQDFEEASDQLVQIILKGCGLQATPR